MFKAFMVGGLLVIVGAVIAALPQIDLVKPAKACDTATPESRLDCKDLSNGARLPTIDIRAISSASDLSVAPSMDTF